MCGIAGGKLFGKEKFDKEQVETLFTEIQSRGKDAAGIAYLTTKAKDLKVVKGNMPADKLIETAEWKKIDFSIVHTFILHTRFATKGSEKNNKNNHPLYNKEGIAVVHNGQISNDDFLFKKFGFHRDGEVDSEIILRLIEKTWWKDISTNLSHLMGPFACASINSVDPTKLMLFRSSNPLNVYMDKEKDIFYFASLKNHLVDTFTPYHRGFRQTEIAVYELNNKTAYLLGKENLEDIVEIENAPVTTTFQGNSWMSKPNTLTDFEIKRAIMDIKFSPFMTADKKEVWIEGRWIERERYEKILEELGERAPLSARKTRESSAMGTTKGTSHFKVCTLCKTETRAVDLYTLDHQHTVCEDCLMVLCEHEKVSCYWCYTPLSLAEILEGKCVCDGEINHKTIKVDA